MTVVERRITAPVAAIGQRDRNIVPEEIDRRDLPMWAVAADGEQPFSGRNKKFLAHPQPPESAWNTWIVLVSLTLSPSRARSRIIRPSTKIVMCLRSPD